MAYPEDLPGTPVEGELDHIPDHEILNTTIGNIDLRLHNNELAATSLDGRLDTAETDITSLEDFAATTAPAIYQSRNQKAQANGYASLDETGKVPSAQIPAQATVPVLVKGVATWSTISALGAPAQGDLYVLQSVDAGAPTRVGGGAAQAGDAIVRTNASTWINSGPFQGPAGAAGEDGAAGASAFPVWTPGVDYPIGTSVRNENNIWTLLEDDPTNGLITGIEPMDVYNAFYTNSSTNNNPPTWFGNKFNATYDTCIIIIQYNQTASPNFTFPSGGVVEITAAARNQVVSGKNIGVKIYYGTAGVPSTNLNGGTAKVTLAVFRGIDETFGPFSSENSQRTAALTDVIQVSNNVNTTITDNQSIVVGGVWAAGSLAGVTGSGNSKGYSYGETYSLGHAAAPMGNSSADIPSETYVPFCFWGFYDSSETPSINYWALSLSGTSRSASGMTFNLGLTHFKPKINGLPNFDKGLWKPLSSDLSSKAPYNLSKTHLTKSSKIVIPKTNGAFLIEHTPEYVGSLTNQNSYVLLPNVPIKNDNTQSQKLRLYFKVQGVRHFTTFAQTAANLNNLSAEAAYSAVLYKDEWLEPGHEPGSSGYIDFEWDSYLSSWVCVSGAGDLIRFRRPTMTLMGRSETAQNATPELGFNVYYQDLNSSEVARAKQLINWIPLNARRVIGSIGGSLDIAKEYGETVHMRKDTIGTVPSNVGGQYASNTKTALSDWKPSDRHGPFLGGNMLHEIGHMFDYEYGSAIANGKAKWLPAPYNTYGSGFSLSTNLEYDVWWQVADNSGYASYLSSFQEWVAEMLFTAWAGNAVMNNLPGAMTLFEWRTYPITNVFGGADPDNKWPVCEAYLKQWGLISYTGNLTVS
jgi:hypothetical protein